MAPSFLERYRGDIDRELRSVIDGNVSPLYAMMRYHMGWTDERGNAKTSGGGKAVRPALCLLSCEAAGGDREKALPAAAALELLHNYSLIHDDVQDDDRERRHVPTVWAIWGKPQAINAGTAMRMLASMALKRLDERGIPLEKRVRAQELLDGTTLRLIEGQCLDIEFETRLDVTTADYLKMIAGKTAALIACSLEMGALLATDDHLRVAGFREVGRNLGMAFQIRDDMLGIWGSEQETGKPMGSDLRRRKKSFPVVYALDRTAGEQKQRLLAIYQKESPDEADVLVAREILERVGAEDSTRQMTQAYCDEARALVATLRLAQKDTRDFEELVQFLVERRS
ncbi:MAG: polyprenyl synthetase family protein [Chloroflexi bacterium]|nr:polyprenyl synthetase family protein [Chloroflexota bacterium]